MHCSGCKSPTRQPTAPPRGRKSWCENDRNMKTYETSGQGYPLAPLQEGMLFHSLYAKHSGVDICQIVCDWEEEVNASLFSRAWQQVAERHSILRTSFSWA